LKPVKISGRKYSNSIGKKPDKDGLVEIEGKWRIIPRQQLRTHWLDKSLPETKRLI